MILTNEVYVTINSSNKKRLEKILNTKLVVGEEYKIDVKYLPNTAKNIIIVKCDICDLELETTYYNYNRNVKRYNFYTCKKCSKIKSEMTCYEKYGVSNYAKTIESKNKQKEFFINKYGVDNPMKNTNIKEKTVLKITSTIDVFINNAKNIHNNKYSYLKADYVNNKTPLIITCPIHGDFKQRPDSHLQGKGCYRCANLKNINFKDKKLYLIRDKKFKIYKIGITLNINKRFKKLNNDLNKNLEICKIFENSGLKEIEVHNHFKKYKINHPIKHGGYTEWFNIDYDILDVINEIENILKI